MGLFELVFSFLEVVLQEQFVVKFYLTYTYNIDIVSILIL